MPAYGTVRPAPYSGGCCHRQRKPV